MSKISNVSLEFSLTCMRGLDFPDLYISTNCVNRALYKMGAYPKKSGITKKEKILATDITSLVNLIGISINLTELKRFCDFDNDVLYKLCMRYPRKYMGAE